MPRYYLHMPARVVQLLILLLPLTGACERGGAGLALDPQEIPIPRERVYLKGPRFQGSQRQLALELVKHYRDEDGGPTVEERLNNEMKKMAGNALFPEWRVQRTAPHRYEVRFLYTQVVLEDRVERRGYAWVADTVLGAVEERRELRPEELSSDAVRPQMGATRYDPLDLE